jgi:hypothetical protein
MEYFCIHPNFPNPIDRKFAITRTNTETLDEQAKRTKSRLENLEKLQLHPNHEKFLFLTVLLLFTQ